MPGGAQPHRRRMATTSQLWTPRLQRAATWSPIDDARRPTATPGRRVVVQCVVRRAVTRLDRSEPAGRPLDCCAMRHRSPARGTRRFARGSVWRRARTASCRCAAHRWPSAAERLQPRLCGVLDPPADRMRIAKAATRVPQWSACRRPSCQNNSRGVPHAAVWRGRQRLRRRCGCAAGGHERRPLRGTARADDRRLGGGQTPASLRTPRQAMPRRGCKPAATALPWQSRCCSANGTPVAAQ
jgi:hypothetical protein